MLEGEAKGQWNSIGHLCLQKQSTPYLLTFAVLIFLNWWIESLKWKILARVHLPTLSLGLAWKSVCMGISLGLITPGRIGDYGGRVLALGPSKGWQLLGSNLLGSLLQLMIIFALGLGAAYILSSKISLPFGVYHPSLPRFLMVILLFGIIFWSLQKTTWVQDIFEKIKTNIGTKIVRLNVIGLYSYGSLLAVVGLTLTRVSIFAVQYYLLLLFVGAEGGVVYFLMVWVVFLLQSLSPVPALVEWFVRGEIALLCWSTLELSVPQIFVATYTLWLGNLLLPGILGFLYFSKYSINYPNDSTPNKIDKPQLTFVSDSNRNSQC
jgi:uncharacterized membrane protein YbhN (UPF0104 family)